MPSVMHIFYFLGLLATAFGAPATTLFHPHNSTAFPILRSETHCNSPIMRWNFINTPDCLKGLRRELPTTHSTGFFHYGGPMDDFRLPQSATKGDCQVHFELVNPHSREEGSWVAIRTAAMELAFGCAVKAEMGLTKGGWTTTGARDGIRITISKPGRRPGVASE